MGETFTHGFHKSVVTEDLLVHPCVCVCVGACCVHVVRLCSSTIMDGKHVSFTQGVKGTMEMTQLRCGL